MTGLARLLHGASTSLVLVYSIRRILFLLASRGGGAGVSEAAESLPSLAIVVACRNEALTVRPLLDALERTEYPGELSIVVVDDGSQDETGDVLEDWAASGSRRHAVRQNVPRGKVRALEVGAAATPRSVLVGVCDADQRPRRDCWRLLARPFEDDDVGAAAGFLRPANHDASIVARYAAVEAWVHQLVTAQGRSRLGLNPPTLGGAAIYRREALADVGGFVGGISGEDVTTSVALTEAGWKSRFVRGAVVDNYVVARWGDYWDQHVRWARGSFDTASEYRRASKASARRRLESVFVSAGYLDRLAFLGASVFAVARSRGRWVPVLYVCAAGLEVCTALARGGVRGPTAPKYLVSLAVLFPVDVLATGVAVVAHLRRRPHAWRSPR